MAKDICRIVLLDALDGGEGLDGGGGLGGEASGQVALGADAVDGDARRDPLVHVADHPLRLAVVRLVQVVVVDVQHRVRVRLARRLERDPHEVLAQHLREHRAPQVSALVENLVYDVLRSGVR